MPVHALVKSVAFDRRSLGGPWQTATGADAEADEALGGPPGYVICLLQSRLTPSYSSVHVGDFERRIMRKSALACGLSMVLLAAMPLRVAAVDTQTNVGDVDLTSVRQKVKAKDWKAAIEELKPIIAKVDNADAYNLYAFSLRNTGDYKQAFTYYGKALDFDPNHKGAHEYLGELYVMTSNMPKANEHLAILEKLCPSGCEELDDLRKAVAEGPKK